MDATNEIVEHVRSSGGVIPSLSPAPSLPLYTPQYTIPDKTVYPRSIYPFYIVTYYIKWVTTSRTDGKTLLEDAYT